MWLLKDGALVPDGWVAVGDDESLPDAHAPIVSLACFLVGAGAGGALVRRRANRHSASIGVARHATIISMSASRNGKPRIRSGYGRTVRHRWRLPQGRRATASWSAP